MQKTKKEKQRKHVRHMLPDILCVMILILSRIISVMIYGLKPAGNLVFYRMADAAGYGTVPFMKHGVSYVYTCFLSVLLHFSEGREETVIIAQLVLQAVVILVFYMAVRRLWGKASSVICLLGTAALPDFLFHYNRISPDLVLCLMTGFLLLVAVPLLGGAQKEKKMHMVIVSLLAGILAGVHLWLDLTGIVIWLAICIGIILRRKILSFFCVLAGTAGSLAASFAVESCMTGVSLTDTILQYCALYFRSMTYVSYPEQVDISWMPEVSVRYVNLAGMLWVLAVSGAIGCFAYVYKKKRTAEKPKGRRSSRKRSPNAAAAEKVPEPEQKEENMTEPDSGISQPKINYIPNPLPLPKKHVKKVIGFDFEPSCDQMKFDFEPKDGDDFDLQ